MNSARKSSHSNCIACIYCDTLSLCLLNCINCLWCHSIHAIEIVMFYIHCNCNRNHLTYRIYISIFVVVVVVFLLCAVFWFISIDITIKLYSNYTIILLSIMFTLFASWRLLRLHIIVRLKCEYILHSELNEKEIHTQNVNQIGEAKEKCCVCILYILKRLHDERVHVRSFATLHGNILSRISFKMRIHPYSLSTYYL